MGLGEMLLAVLYVIFGLALVWLGWWWFHHDPKSKGRGPGGK
ncbi:hypothetical protein [Micromonospora rubida]|nr:hypothetical protein [Micromonospora rubida]